MPARRYRRSTSLSSPVRRRHGTPARGVLSSEPGTSLVLFSRDLISLSFCHGFSTSPPVLHLRCTPTDGADGPDCVFLIPAGTGAVDFDSLMRVLLSPAVGFCGPLLLEKVPGRTLEEIDHNFG